IKSRANELWALGTLTFPHQLIRIFAVEQIYRAHTILKGEPYHHP
ncbi:MAG: 23S rRNA (pseudouridine(1915)-N(3))-methyltransferase RlmH, partial [Flavobacteriales bacterium]|nr:23S rRNA (pseudouridine(1915)-N(3))-methyltransferase RlmH [Flavobacteriales bacterium]